MTDEATEALPSVPQPAKTKPARVYYSEADITRRNREITALLAVPYIAGKPYAPQTNAEAHPTMSKKRTASSSMSRPTQTAEPLQPFRRVQPMPIGLASQQPSFDTLIIHHH